MKRVPLLAWALLLLCSPAFAANGPSPAVVGTKGPVSMPVDGDAQAAYRFPSTIGWALNDRLDIDLFLFFSRTTLENSQNDYTASGTAFGGSLGAIFVLDRPDFEANPDAFEEYSYANKFTIHVGEYVTFAGGGGTAEVRSTAFPETKDVGTGVTFLTTALTLAYTPTKWLSLAISLHFIYGNVDAETLSGGGDAGLAGSPTINGVPIPGNPTYTDFLNLFASDEGSDPSTFLETDLTAFQFTANFSFSIRPNDMFGFAFSYTPRSTGQDFEGDSTVDATRTFENALGGLAQPIQDIFLATLPNGGQNGFVSNYDIKITSIKAPRRIRGAFAFWPFPEWVLAFEVAWVEWSRALDRAEVELTNGSNEDLNFVVGSTTVTTDIKLRFSNRFIYAFYTAYAPTDYLTLRLGFSYGKSPLNPDENGNGPSAGFIDTHITAGAGFRITPNLEIAFLAEYGVRNEEESDGSSDSLTGRFSEYSSEQLFLHVGLGWNF